MGIKIMHIGGTTFIGDLVSLGRVLRNPRVIRAEKIESTIAGAPPRIDVTLSTLFDTPASMEVGGFHYAYPASAQTVQMYHQAIGARGPIAPPITGKTAPENGV